MATRSPLSNCARKKSEYEEIRERWEDVAPKTWIGQT
jgi:hypothetical protein